MTLPKINFKPFLKTLLVLAIIFAVNFLATALSGVVAAAAGAGQNAAVTLALTVLAYLMASFNKLSYRQTAWFLAYAVILSFVTGLIPGTLAVLILPGLLKRLRLV